MTGDPDTAARGTAEEHAFDLNIEKVLENWAVPFAIRELMANALDEQALTGTAEPEVFKDAGGTGTLRTPDGACGTST